MQLEPGLSNPSNQRPIIAAGAVIRNAAGDVLLVRRGRPPRLNEWSIPGGKVEWSEPVLVALEREIMEETGLKVTLGPLLDVVDALIQDEVGALTHHYVLLDYAAEHRSGVARAGDDVVEVRWVAEAALDGYAMWSETRRVIAKALSLEPKGPAAHKKPK